MQRENTSNRLDSILFAIFIIFLVSIVFSLRAVSSISIGLILLTGIIRKEKARICILSDKWNLLFLIGCVLLFLIQCVSSLYSKHIENTLRILQMNSGLVFVPLSVFISRDFFTVARFRKIMFYLSIILSAASVYCLGFALVKYSGGSSYKVFFYHDLVKPLSQHAIQFSILVFTTLAFLIENRKEKGDTLFNLPRRLMSIFLSIFLILLSSKLIICFYVFYLLYDFFNNQFSKRRSKVFVVGFVAITSILLLTPNPVGNRFRAVFTGNNLLFEQKEFDPGIHFNGVQFRLLQWRFTYEILNEQHAWVSGLTPGDAQFFLDKKYIATKMYTGVTGTDNRGFLGYHTHNQFLQVLLENGLPGLAVFLFICYTLFKMAAVGQRKELKWLVVLLLVYCFTDAPLQTQYGMIIFMFLPMLSYLGPKPTESKQASAFDNAAVRDTNYSLGGINFQKQPN
jgi:O-antigen ligase